MEPDLLSSVAGARLEFFVASVQEGQLAGSGGEVGDRSGRWKKAQAATGLMVLSWPRVSRWRRRTVRPQLTCVLTERNSVHQTCGPCGSFKSRIRATDEDRFCTLCGRRAPFTWAWSRTELEPWFEEILAKEYPDLDVLQTALLANEIVEHVDVFQAAHPTNDPWDGKIAAQS